MLETLNHHRDPQECSRSLKRLSSLDMADNLKTREETAEKVERKEKPQHLTQKLVGEIFL